MNSFNNKCCGFPPSTIDCSLQIDTIASVSGIQEDGPMISEGPDPALDIHIIPRSSSQLLYQCVWLKVSELNLHKALELESESRLD